MQHVSNDSDIQRTAEEFVALGWTIEGKSRGKHYHLVSPSGKIRRSVPLSPSCYRAKLNFRSQMRRAHALDMEGVSHDQAR